MTHTIIGNLNKHNKYILHLIVCIGRERRASGSSMRQHNVHMGGGGGGTQRVRSSNDDLDSTMSVVSSSYHFRN